MIRNIQQAEKFLQRLYAVSWQVTGKDVTLDRMWPILRLANDPQNRLKVIHIAGTSGKTSTAYFISSLLQQGGAKVGLTVSPHIQSVTERLQIDGNQVSEEYFCSRLNEFIAIVGENPDASYFEFMIAFILWVFDAEKVDYAVLETGLGGMYDCTNVCQRPDKVCVITDIGFDHQKVLGNKLTEIAAQKAGIIHSGNNVFYYQQSEEIINEINQRALSVGASLHQVSIKDNSVFVDNFAIYQKRNWQLAKSVYDFIASEDHNLSNLEPSSLLLSQVSVPGRMQRINYKGKTLILDGAHNEQKMKAFVDSFVTDFPNQKVPVVLAMKDDKDYEKAVVLLKQVASKVVVTSFNASQDINIRSVDPNHIAEVCARHQIPVMIETNLFNAIETGTKENEPVCIVTGSLYMLGDVLKYAA